jgi:hypothetical protein
VRQLLTESLILALFAAAGGFIVSRVAFSAAIYALAVTLPPEISESVGVAVPPADWRVIMFLIGGAAAATMFFGLTPALRASRVELVRAMRGEVMRDARPVILAPADHRGSARPLRSCQQWCCCEVRSRQPWWIPVCVHTTP